MQSSKWILIFFTQALFCFLFLMFPFDFLPFFSSFLILQLSTLIQCFPENFPEYRIEVIVISFCRIVDLERFCITIFDEMNKEIQSELVKRLGYLNIINPIQPDRFYDLDLSVRDNHEITKMLVRLAIVEPGLKF